MAHVRPSLVADSTNTSGTGSYTLIGADPGGGLRALVDAVGDGDAANADTISYFVVDTTTSGATLAWEHGTGTISGGGTTLARTTIIESSNGDAAVSWGAGGTRTVRFGAGTAGFAQLAAAQTFTALQTLSAGLTLTGGAALTIGSSQVTTGAGHTFGERPGVATDAQLASNRNVLVMIDANNTTTTAGFQVFKDGSFAGSPLFSVTEAGAVTASGTAVALQGVLSAPAGMRLLSLWTTIPIGWSVVASTSDKTILTTVTAAEASTTGGSWTISGLTGSTTVDNATVTVNNATLTILMNGGIGGGTNPVDQVTHGHTTVAHNHTASTTVSSGGSWRPAWIKALVIVKS